MGARSSSSWHNPTCSGISQQAPTGIARIKAEWALAGSKSCAPAGNPGQGAPTTASTCLCPSRLRPSQPGAAPKQARSKTGCFAFSPSTQREAEPGKRSPCRAGSERRELSKLCPDGARTHPAGAGPHRARELPVPSTAGRAEARANQDQGSRRRLQPCPKPPQGPSPLRAPRETTDTSYLRGAGPYPGDNDLLALRLVGHLDPVSHLDVFLQDEPAAEGPFALCAVPAGPEQGGNEAMLRSEEPSRRPAPARLCSH